MCNNCNIKNKHLTIAERKLIQKWNKEKKSNREIARLLGRSHQTINNELKRGKVVLRNSYGKEKLLYDPQFSQNKYNDNKKKCGRKVRVNYIIRDKILHFLKQKYSPEMISKIIVNNEISTSTIYYWINHSIFGLDRKYILYKRKNKKSQYCNRSNKRILGKSIEERDARINNREEFGHFEIDTVVLSKEKSKNNVLLTLTDRKTRYQIIRLMNDKTYISVNNEMKQILKDYPIKSITADNGSEFARLYEVFSYENIYYSHPFSSFERGTNENHNRLIRRFLPKGTKNTTHQRVAFIENWINNYPKKIFNYKTPFQMLMTG